ncbi:unnamed protein product [Durusdinium trenchii]|uniref:Calmodulin-lysine N-methyltransferase n=1 Tax=Durusdinium trenchii TaxID=1381693 RepID=A0ABP0PM39_9DINO
MLLDVSFGPGLDFSLRQRPDDFVRGQCRAQPAALAKSPTEASRRTGCVAWDASVVLAGVLVKLNSSDPKLEKVLQCPMPCSTLNALSSALTAASEHGVLELGAGETGLVGLVASKLWRQSCVLTDMPDVIPHLQRNIDAAELSPPPRAVAYEWGTEWGVEHTAAGTGSGTFGVVLAADCIYDTENVDPFVDALREISGEESELLVAYDTALQRWGAYRRFLDLVECQWHVELLADAQLEGFRKAEDGTKIESDSSGIPDIGQSLCDPTFGKAVYNPRRIAESWEDFLDALGFQSSPIRQHVRQLFNREDLEEQLQGLFDALSGGLPALDKGGFLNFSSNIRGQVHVLMDMKTKISLLPPTAEDSQWIQQNFDAVFPAEEPLDRAAFPGVAKASARASMGEPAGY